MHLLSSRSVIREEGYLFFFFFFFWYCFLGRRFRKQDFSPGIPKLKICGSGADEEVSTLEIGV